MRSGLLLAGAGAPTAAGAPQPPPNSALVTALELAGLNLWGTQLVVLSACDTGRGDVKQGQGVYGLRRALVVAGAETVVMSLWKVDDETTSTLMEAYYRRGAPRQPHAAAALVDSPLGPRRASYPGDCRGGTRLPRERLAPLGSVPWKTRGRPSEVPSDPRGQA